ncbi:MAG: tetratricopeptide repeat protein [Ardenticatenaceae bacterium]|nr:tetratricopeptide repeat protein [Ardenticatenaceae bacterium]
MPAKNQSQNTTLTSFLDQIRAALNHFQDADWLGRQSPLAAPYFLGEWLSQREAAHDTAVRGGIFQDVLLQAADHLWPGEIPADKELLAEAVHDERQQQGNKGRMYLFFLLELRYFRRFFRKYDEPAADNDIALANYLSISRASYFNHLKEAQLALGEELLRQVRPTLRLEFPPLPPAALVGRDQAVADVLAALEEMRAVQLIGLGGVGKTAVGAAAARRWERGPVFWYTLRAGFNDRPDCLLFSLAYFLQQHHPSGLWQQLLADDGRIRNLELALAHIRGDLERLPGQPLLVFDESEVLSRSSDDGAERLETTQLRELLNGLQQVIPLLLVGQRVTFETPVVYDLLPLSEADQIHLLTTLGLPAALVRKANLLTIAAGNPRLLYLMAALFQRGVSAEALVEVLPRSTSMRGLWQRLWDRLAEEERGFCQQLAVFRGAAPADEWLQLNGTLSRLVEHRLVNDDGRGGLFLLPMVQSLLLNDWRRFTADQRDLCHEVAAEVRLTRGEIVDGAFHLAQAGRDELAVQSFFPYMQQEIQRGLAGIALDLFQQISPERLPQREQRSLRLVRGQLQGVMGDFQSGLAELRQVRWPRESEMTVLARRLEGMYLRELGYPDQALTQMEDGISAVNRLQQRLIHFRQLRGGVHIQQRALDEAWREAQLAQYEAAHLLGMVYDERGQYDEAGAQFNRALQLAEAAGYPAGLARTHRELATTLGRQARLTEALNHAEAALKYYQQIGDRLTQEIVRSIMAFTYVQAGRFPEAIAAAEPAWRFLQRAQVPYWTAVTGSNLAEAYAETGALEQAEHTAQQVLRYEEVHTRPYALHTLGLIARQRENFKESLDFFAACRDQAAENQDRYLVAYALRGLGETHLAAGDRQAALPFLRESLEAFTELKMEEEVGKTAKLIAG